MQDADTRSFTNADLAVLAVAVAGFGLAYGATSVAYGISPVKTVVLSLISHAGAGQLGVMAVLAGGGSAATALAAGMLIGARYFALGLAAGPRLPGTVPRRLVAAHFLVDGTAALALTTTTKEEGTRLFWRAGVTLLSGWTLGTMIGAYGGRFITDVKVFGLDAALPALLIALIASWLRDTDVRRAAGIGAGAALVLHLMTPAGVPVLLGAGIGFAATVLLMQREGRLTTGRSVGAAPETAGDGPHADGREVDA